VEWLEKENLGCREENRRLREYAGMLGGDPAAFLGEMVRTTSQ
jgi:hypothetical protein